MGQQSMFRYADKVGKLLMLFGMLGSFRDGIQTPLMMFILSDVINAYGDPNVVLTMHDINKYALRLFYAGIGVGLSAFVEGMCWARTAERQTSIYKEHEKEPLEAKKILVKTIQDDQFLYLLTVKNMRMQDQQSEGSGGRKCVLYLENEHNSVCLWFKFVICCSR